MTGKIVTTIRLDPTVKEQADDVFGCLGLTFSSAVNIFLKAVVRDNGLPFDLKQDASGNASLNKAGTAKKDEFYTRLEDVEAEMSDYENSFKGKIVYCNCDNPLESAFFRYFVLNFSRLGLKSLRATCYDRSLNMNGEFCKPYKAIVTQVPSQALDGNAFDVHTLFSSNGNELSLLDGDGDFKSDECVHLLDESDVVATNPPFSLFRDYISLLNEHHKKYIVIGNVNALTYKEVFPLFKANMIRMGSSIHSGDRKFGVPRTYPLDAVGCGEDEYGRFVKVKGIRWFTNMRAERREHPLELTCPYDPSTYAKYENYDAINIPRTSMIPYDYEGLMGVPITFLDHYDPEQFEIVMLANGNARTNTPGKILESVGYHRHPEDRGGVGIIDGKRTYARILIRNRRPEVEGKVEHHG